MYAGLLADVTFHNLLLAFDGALPSKTRADVIRPERSATNFTASSTTACPRAASTSKRRKWPRTLETPRWRMEKPTDEWLVSRAQRPAASGRVVVVVMGRACAQARAARKAAVSAGTL